LKGKLLVHILQDSLRPAFEPHTHLLATRFPHQFYQLFIHVYRVKDAPPSYIQAPIDKLATDFLGMGWRKVEGIIHEEEFINSGFTPTGDPLNNRPGGMPPDLPAFNGFRGTIAAI
jgi:hypothetical protein